MFKYILLVIIFYFIINFSEESGYNYTWLYEEMKSLSNALNFTIRNLPKGGGGQFLEDMDTYTDKLRYLLILAQKDRQKLNSTIYRVRKGAPPTYLRVNYSEDALKSSFGWSENELNLMNEYIVTTKNYWKYLLNLEKNIKRWL